MITFVGFNPAIDRSLELANFEVGGVAKARLLAIQPAGKAANAARVFAALGGQARLSGFIGAGEASLFADSFAGSPVAVELVQVAGATRINTTLIHLDKGCDTHIREEGFQVSAEDIFRLESSLLASVSSKAAVADAGFVFNGSLPPGLQPVQAAGIMEKLRCRGCWLAADASGSFLQAIGGLPLSLLKVNREELGELMDCATPASGGDMLNLARKYCAREVRAETLLLSDGEHGAGVFYSGKACWCQALPARVASTVGAGDALLSGYLYGMQIVGKQEDALKYGMAAAHGAVESLKAGCIDRKVVEQVLEQHRVESI